MWGVIPKTSFPKCTLSKETEQLLALVVIYSSNQYMDRKVNRVNYVRYHLDV